MNNRIRAREVRLIDENGTQVGIVPLREALAMAEERGYDLVEVAPNAVPPVCRLLDYGKFRYEQSKKEREARRNQKQSELKQIRLMPKTDDHDVAVKANQARRFLLAGDKVKFNLRFRGREMAHPEIGRKMLDEIAEQLSDIAVIEQKPLMEGRVLSMLLAPTAKVLKAAQQAQKAAAQRQAAANDQSAQAPAAPVATPANEEEDLVDEDEIDEDDDLIDEDEDYDDDEDEDYDDEQERRRRR
ncbi:translation initiation factor IF-3 [uncultured Chloroflexus sp.]|uniref:translation initiation factor IF-3 n=1 Tax=uncultured Chloroflexus sp. TaxID=214040 RepID=UPI0026394498|nr:translation initiation factor IF-3 [uncultured Chloroflexus sp.]